MIEKAIFLCSKYTEIADSKLCIVIIRILNSINMMIICLRNFKYIFYKCYIFIWLIAAHTFIPPLCAHFPLGCLSCMDWIHTLIRVYYWRVAVRQESTGFLMAEPFLLARKAVHDSYLPRIKVKNHYQGTTTVKLYSANTIVNIHQIRTWTMWTGNRRKKGGKFGI